MLYNNTVCSESEYWIIILGKENQREIIFKIDDAFAS
jgi:hypothetical protein